MCANCIVPLASGATTTCLFRLKANCLRRRPWSRFCSARGAPAYLVPPSFVFRQTPCHGLSGHRPRTFGVLPLPDLSRPLLGHQNLLFVAVRRVKRSGDSGPHGRWPLCQDLSLHWVFPTRTVRALSESPSKLQLRLWSPLLRWRGRSRQTGRSKGQCFPSKGSSFIARPGRPSAAPGGCLQGCIPNGSSSTVLS